ncbi:MAG: alpha/beta hydrolase [Solimonas sp.]
MLAAAAASAPVSLKFDSGFSHEGEGPLKIAVDVFAPPGGVAPRALLWCLPGGNMNRRYYDLLPPREDGNGDGGGAPDDSDGSFSFARTLAAQGYVVASADYLGLGDSDRPNDGWLCTPDNLTAINRHVYAALLAQLHAGTAHPRLGPLPGLRSIGVGHSMGGMMTILQQAAQQPHVALAVMGFSTRGLPDYVPKELHGVDSLVLRPKLTGMARKAFGEPFPIMQRTPESRGIFGGNGADPRGIVALKAASDAMLPIPAFLSMLPGNVAPEAETVTVPVFLALGSRDMAGPPHQVPAAFPNSADVTLHIAAEAGHAHFLFASRARLFARVDAWARTVMAE